MSIRDEVPIVEGSIAGIVAWVVAYSSTYLLVANDVRDSGLHQIIAAFEGEPATFEMVGWVFFNAHGVDTVFSDLPIFGSHSTTFIGGDDGLTTLLYLIPIAVIFAVGFGLTRYHAADTIAEGSLIGVSLWPGYFLMTVIGLFLFQVSIGGATGQPDLLPGIVVAGIGIPVVVGTFGGVVAGWVGAREQQ